MCAKKLRFLRPKCCTIADVSEAEFQSGGWHSMTSTRSAFHGAVALGFLAAFLFGAIASAQTLQVLHDFGGTIGSAMDGATPYAGLTFDSQGNLYGTTARGGQMFCLLDGCGIAFQLKPNSGSWTENVLYQFGNGGTPVAPVVLDRAGNVYGTFACTQDCFNNSGGVFQLQPRANGVWAETTLTNSQFTGCGNGVCGVRFFNSPTRLYGLSQQMYNDNTGEAFSVLHPSLFSWYALVLYGFNGGGAGGAPSLYFSFDGNGDIYGTTATGGAHGMGTVFKLVPNGAGFGWIETILYSFQGGQDGAAPSGGVIFDGAGDLYGTTTSGGSSGAGTIFELAQSGGNWTENVMYSFAGGSDASAPAGPLTFDSAGNLYGVAGGGAAGQGAIFKLTSSSGHWSESLVYSFSGGLDGGDPAGGVIFDNSGNIYGTTVHGGAYPSCQDEPYCGGVAYEITP
jgi:uncharacterized repeat protein (TIGR03803 family)